MCTSSIEYLSITYRSRRTSIEYLSNIHRRIGMVIPPPGIQILNVILTIYRTSTGNRTSIYRKFIRNLSIIYRTSIGHQSNIYWVYIDHPIIYRTSIDHVSAINRSYIGGTLPVPLCASAGIVKRTRTVLQSKLAALVGWHTPPPCIPSSHIIHV